MLLSSLRRAIYVVPNLFATNAVNAIQVISEVQLDKAQLSIDKETLGLRIDPSNYTSHA